MAHRHSYTHVSDEDRRAFLKALGVTGAVAAGGATIDEVRNAASTEATAELAPIGQSIRADLGGTLDAEFIATQQSELIDAAGTLTATIERGLPSEEPREEFAAVAQTGRPVYDHFSEVGFFESTTQNLPELDPGYLESAVSTFVGSEALAGPLAEIGFDGTEGVDLLATVIGNAERLSDYHWIATDQIPRERIEFGEHIPAMTKAAAGGVLLWLDDLDHYLWQDQVLITDKVLQDAVWHGQAMAAGFHLMSEGARAIGAESDAYSDAELGALLSTGFAVQAISQGLVPQDVYWLTEDMRTPHPEA
jgi:hypothetical protein